MVNKYFLNLIMRLMMVAIKFFNENHLILIVRDTACCY